MANIWLTSDLHLGHKNIIDFCDRPFLDVEDMNETIIELWNNQVQREDIVYILGDLVMGRIDETLPMVRRLCGHKHLWMGNHDRCHPIVGNLRSIADWKTRYADEGGIESFSLTSMMQGFLFCHFPYMGDSHDLDRFSAWRPEDKGEWQIHGHVHDAWLQRGRMINVGIDAWGGRLVSLEEVSDLRYAGPRELESMPWV